MATKKGGYILVDFQKISLSRIATTIPGIYERLTGTSSKAIKITGVVINLMNYPDADVSISIDPLTYNRVIFYAYDHFFTITKTNRVSVYSAEDPTATLTTLGTVKQAAEVQGAAGNTVTKEELNALIQSLKNAGIMEG